MILKLVEGSDRSMEYGFLTVGNEFVSEKDIQNMINEFKNSYKAYGYSTLKEMREDGYKTEEELINSSARTTWTIDQLVASFPKTWKVSLHRVCGIVEC